MRSKVKKQKIKRSFSRIQHNWQFITNPHFCSYFRQHLWCGWSKSSCHVLICWQLCCIAVFPILLFFHFASRPPYLKVLTRTLQIQPCSAEAELSPAAAAAAGWLWLTFTITPWKQIYLSCVDTSSTHLTVALSEPETQDHFLLKLGFLH